jgi:ABC-type iron transport system FetAB permease component
MRVREIVLLLVIGFVFWMAGTLWFERVGPRVFETTAIRYWVNFVLSPLVSAVGCSLILRWQHIPASGWTTAINLVALPGMFGEAILLSNFSTLMPRMHESSAGKYGAFLFATYGLVLAIAEIVTLRAVSIAAT